MNVGRILRNMEAPVDAGVWAAISSQIKAPVKNISSNMGFAANVAVGLIILSGLAVYSSYREVNVSQKASTSMVIEEKTDSNPDHKSIASVVIENVEDKQAESNSSIDVYENINSQPAKTSSDGSQKVENQDHESESIPQASADAALPAASSTPKLNNVWTPKPVSEQISGRENTQPTASENASAIIKASAYKGYTPLIVSFENIGHGDQQHWDFGAKGKSEQALASVTYTEPGIYSVFLTVEDGQGNTKTDAATIEVLEGSNLLAPDSFTPNGDGLNDTYKVEGLHIAEFQLNIVNSKGKSVFETFNIHTAWEYERSVHGGDGEFYFAVIRARGIDGQEYSFFKRLNIVY